MYKKDNYYTNQHSCFLLQYHLVLVTKYRKHVINNTIREQLLEYTKNYFTERGLRILEINTEQDHIYILFEAYPNMNLASYVNAYKSGSSRYIRKQNETYLKEYYWKPYFWSNTYFIGTVSERTISAVENYIRNQQCNEEIEHAFIIS